jgi:hypothetical protein
MNCPSCGGQVMTAGCVNPSCAMSMGGTYVNGVKVATASGRVLVPESVRPKIPACPTCGTPMALAFWDRPGGPPGNGWRCLQCFPQTQEVPPRKVDEHER